MSDLTQHIRARKHDTCFHCHQINSGEILRWSLRNKALAGQRFGNRAFQYTRMHPSFLLYTIHLWGIYPDAEPRRSRGASASSGSEREHASSHSLLHTQTLSISALPTPRISFARCTRGYLCVNHTLTVVIEYSGKLQSTCIHAYSWHKLDSRRSKCAKLFSSCSSEPSWFSLTLWRHEVSASSTKSDWSAGSNGKQYDGIKRFCVWH